MQQWRIIGNGSYSVASVALTKWHFMSELWLRGTHEVRSRLQPTDLLVLSRSQVVAQAHRSTSACNTHAGFTNCVQPW